MWKSEEKGGYGRSRSERVRQKVNEKIGLEVRRNEKEGHGESSERRV